ncbi:MAG: hypothetical protein ACI8QF_002120, partial [Limisphaerales bacterium]
EGVAGVQVTLFMTQVFVRQQNLGDPLTMSCEQPLVRRHQAQLTDRRASLEFCQPGRSLLEIQSSHAGADGARADDDNLLASLPERGQLVGQLTHPCAMQAIAFIRKQTRPQLHDNPTYIFEQLATHAAR